MIDFETSNLLARDFEKYMLMFYTKHKRFTLEDFGSFASTVLNFSVQNQQINSGLKKEYAYFLTTLYNKGMGNRIIEEHLQVIAQAIAADSSIDFSIIQDLYG